jgi:hypothetical protein
MFAPFVLMSFFVHSVELLELPLVRPVLEQSILLQSLIGDDTDSILPCVYDARPIFKRSFPLLSHIAEAFKSRYRSIVDDATLVVERSIVTNRLEKVERKPVSNVLDWGKQVTCELCGAVHDNLK